MVKFFPYLLFGSAVLVLPACEQAGLPLLKVFTPEQVSAVGSDEKSEEFRSVHDLSSLIEVSHSKVDVDLGFSKAILQAVDQDPTVLAAKNEAAASKANLRYTKTGADTQYNATVLAGIEDITDETVGVAAVLTAKRMLYDGGLLNAKIDVDTFLSKAADHYYLTVRDARALKLAHAWIDLELYQSLTNLINSRLGVLDPLLEQLERVTAAGVGDVSQVASAERVVSLILIAETDVSAKYQQAKTAFINDFGSLPENARYDASWVSAAVPKSTISALVEGSPGLLAKYWAYRAAEASVMAVQAQDDIRIGFEVKLQRPFGGSDANSDESVGFVITKDLHQGDKLASQLSRVDAIAKSKAAEVSARYRAGELAISSAREVVKSMDTAIKLARSNAASSRQEIQYLRKQLIIGGSTLESVLSAEARLYDAESKEIYFIADHRKAEATILGTAGLFLKPLSSN